MWKVVPLCVEVGATAPPSPYDRSPWPYAFDFLLAAGSYPPSPYDTSPLDLMIDPLALSMPWASCSRLAGLLLAAARCVNCMHQAEGETRAAIRVQ